jgi:hypothetical protein
MAKLALSSHTITCCFASMVKMKRIGATWCEKLNFEDMSEIFDMNY